MENEREYFDDGAFYLKLSRFGLWNSVDRDGTSLVSGLDKDAVIFWAREHLNGFQNSTKSSPKKDSGYKL